MSYDEQKHRDMVAAMPRVRNAPVYTAIIVTSGCFVFGALAFRQQAPGIMPILIVLGIIGLLIGGILWAGEHERVHQRSIEIVAEHMGLTADIKPVREERAILFSPFSGLKMLSRGAGGLKLWLDGNIDGYPVTLIEHQYVVSTGKSSHVVTHTVVATPVSPTWPRLSLSPQQGLASWWAALTGKDFKVENEEFNKRWIVRTDNPDFTLLFLTPEVQQFLTEAPTAETWHIADGSLCWMVRKHLKPRELTPPFHRLAQLRALLPPELDHWG